MGKQAELEGTFCDPEKESYDAIVVGSGYGGSVAAYRMSMAGIRVCLIEKGRKWEAEDFPTNSLQILSATRIENQNLGISFGPSDALFQIYEQNDSLAVVACGLGGGSLINAGVMLRTPGRARRNSKWPEEWETDWDVCEATASSMLRAQSVPHEFPISKVMGAIVDGDIEESFEGSMKLSMNFDSEGPQSTSVKPQPLGSCLACGNCLAGCPYNAKNSTDKNYLALAIKAGCVVKTGSKVHHVIQSASQVCEEDQTNRKRRWIVYFNEIDYITSDFVILSAGVFGTSEILFQSQMRGLGLSEMLGSGLSCNGNNVAYLAGSQAPLSGYGLDRKQISKIPFQERPGPSISSSYTSSLGFTIQGAVLPTAYPYLLFKGIKTYGWPTGDWFIHGLIEKLKSILGLEVKQAMALNAMGHDKSDGKITFKKDTNKICFTPPQDPLLPRKIEAFQKITKKLGGVLFMSRYRSTSVHLLGGCIAATDQAHGVCDSKGRVFDTKAHATVHPGLYVCDASIIPCSIGVNPSMTIATAAEHVSRHLVLDVVKYKSEKGKEHNAKAVGQNRYLITQNDVERNHISMVIIKETMRGNVGGMPCTAYLKMKMRCQNQMGVDKLNWVIGDSNPLLRGKVGGYVVFRSVEKDKLYVTDGEVNLCEVDSRTPYTQYMHYRLLLAGSSGSRYILEGRKIMNPFFYALNAWSETTTLYTTFKKLTSDNSVTGMVNLKGKLRISILDLLKSLISLEGTSRLRFTSLLCQTFLRTYILQIPRGSQKSFTPPDSYHIPYPSSTLHEMKTGDGFIISCRQWKCMQNPCRVQGEKQLNPVLLLNGHSMESYWLPTEPQDLVRTLLEEGYETWLLQPRLHPLNPSNNFTMEDIGRFDIPSVIEKIVELHGPCTKVHVIAHCVGGLAMHMALMGGHVSAAHIASLTCTNSSMFFKLNAFSRVKMWIPLVPISMAILGKDKTLPLLETSKASARHQLLKSIARFIPRYERCTCNECEVLSGLFGNAFWHENVSPSMHNWLNKQNSTKLPMAGFPHLRKICNNGFIVDSKGNNSFLMHPERMTLPTLYISGGRTLLVTPETSFLANKYMKLHQPGFRHERVVVDGFGHSDLLIGEESYKKVFPHILSHIRLAEEGGTVARSLDRRQASKEEALNWGQDPYEEPNGGFGRLVLPLVILWLLLLFIVKIF